MHYIYYGPECKHGFIFIFNRNYIPSWRIAIASWTLGLSWSIAPYKKPTCLSSSFSWKNTNLFHEYPVNTYTIKTTIWFINTERDMQLDIQKTKIPWKANVKLNVVTAQYWARYKANEYSIKRISSWMLIADLRANFRDFLNTIYLFQTISNSEKYRNVD